MKSDIIDSRILELIREDASITDAELAEKLGIGEEEVKERLKKLTDLNIKILIVEDEVDTLLPLRRALESEGYTVVEATDGPTALSLVEKEHPDLILLDLMLPEMDGYEVCRRLRSNPRTDFIPIIMLTARSDIKDKIEGMDLGADDYVTKPFNLQELKARIRMILRRRQI